jgi:hypothetical protein
MARETQALKHTEPEQPWIAPMWDNMVGNTRNRGLATLETGPAKGLGLKLVSSAPNPASGIVPLVPWWMGSRHGSFFVISGW